LTLLQPLFPRTAPAEETAEEAPRRLPLPWLIAVLITAVWWPIDTYWLSDDWLAVHYASDFGRALRDFAGNQYGLPGVVWFYRPLITLSFALDYAVAGTDPFFAHLSNAVALGVSAMLLGLIAHRFFGAAAAWWTALVWGTAPLHAGSVLWAVGRVDSHTVVWILASASCLVRWCDGARRARAAALLCAGLALASKELAVVLPGIAAVLCWALAPPGRRWSRAWSGSWPFFALLVPYGALRLLLFGRLVGGYSGEALAPHALAAGFGTWTARALDPLAYLSAEGLAPFDLPADLLRFWWIGLVPAAAGALALALRRPAALLALAALYVGCAIPMAQFWPHVDGIANLRYLTLPFAALAAVVAGGRAWTAVPALALCVLPHLEVRRDWLESFARTKRIHDFAEEACRHLPRGPVFVAGLARQNEKRDVVEFHVGVDRMLEPPFGAGHRVYALRPLSNLPGAHRIPHGDTVGLPVGYTLALMGSTGILQLEQQALPAFDAAIEGEHRLTPVTLYAIRDGDGAFVLGTPRASHYRITLFTAGGYLSCTLPNEAPPQVDGGRVALGKWLAAETGHGTFAATDLCVPAALDLEPRFPVLIEGGRQEETAAGPVFEATHAARAFVWIEVDRAYAALLDH
jgi:hypothetical protein